MVEPVLKVKVPFAVILPPIFSVCPVSTLTVAPASMVRLPAEEMPFT